MKLHDLWPLLVLIARCAFVLLAEQSFQNGQYSECRVDDPIACNQSKHEVCMFRNGRYSCQCPQGVGRSVDGRCIVINECSEQRLNDCHENAICIDQIEGYTCRCLNGFADVSEDVEKKPGRICQKEVNECIDPVNYNIDCSENAKCQDTAEGFTCICNPGYTDISAHYSRLPGRKCVENVNECHSGTNDCSPDAECIDQPIGYICKCKEGFVDASPNTTHYPGRQCIAPKSPQYINEAKSQQMQFRCHPVFKPICSMNQVCLSGDQGMHSCQCPQRGILTSNGQCITFNHCEKYNDCDLVAICSNTYDGYQCQCPPGFLDTSSDPLRLPGRKCTRLINECGTNKHDCSPYATCIDTLESYLCQCNAGYTDVSSRYDLKPGRRCAQSRNQCANRLANSCDENADCVTLPDGYTCICVTGYFDVSSNAKLPPGRVLRFVKDFIELFDVSPQQTHVAVIQYSDVIRHEIDLNQYSSMEQLKQAINGIEYLTGLTRTGAAIQHVTDEGFSERRGARPIGNGVPRILIVITDGRSQDDVTIAVRNARMKQIQLFAVGVTNHALDSELEVISGSTKRTFHVNAFEDLNARLRSAIQKVTCPAIIAPPVGPSIFQENCILQTHAGCDRTLNQICTLKNGKPCCACPMSFELHPITRICGGALCNPQLVSSCPSPEICQMTPYGNYRCTCPPNTIRDQKSGACTTKHVPSMPGIMPDECGQGKPCQENEHCAVSSSGRRICQCLPGYVAGPSGKCQASGTCQPYLPNACDQRRNEECLPDGHGGFTCQCAANQIRHPVTQICLVDECATGMHDCDEHAKCIDTDEGYICTCKEGYIDESPDQSRKPGRVCRQQTDECAQGTHNCSAYADCINLPKGYFCRCKANYVDFSPNPQHFGGTYCKPLVDECANRSLNTCSKNAICIDTMESYKCQCKEGFIDHDELRNPGRICEQANRFCVTNQNDCDKNAKCIEKGTNEYICVCEPGYIDKSPEPTKPGRICLERICNDPSKHDCHPAAVCTEIAKPERYTCSCRNGYIDINPSKPGRACKELVNECLDPSLNDCDPAAKCNDLKEGYTCTCPPDFKDLSVNNQKPGRKCSILVNECINPHLNNCSRFADCKDLEDGYECICKAGYRDINPAKPGTDCKLILNECESSNLNNCDKNAKCTDTEEGFRCECIPPYIDQNPSEPGTICRKEGFPCGEMTCQEELGEICSEDQLCVCPSGQKRPNADEKCRAVESWSLPLWVIRQNTEELNYNDNLANPQNDRYKELVNAFEKGIAESYANTPLKNGFVIAEVNEITRPSDFIKVGKSMQYISPIQANPFDNCYKSDCHPDAKCTSTPTGYTCECPDTHRDLNPSKPGRECVSLVGVNECEQKEWNECDEHARCIDQDHLYRCECIKPYVNAAPPGKLPGSECRINYCADVNFCPANTTCQNGKTQAECICKEGYVDIRSSPFRDQLNYPENVYCLRLQDVDECALGLTNCSAVAICTDLRNGYQCRCPDGYVDGNPDEPGRICAAQLCGLCNGHGDCIYNEATKNVTCSCVGGYTGKFCEIEPSKTLLLLFLILAILLLLLSLCLCLYFCSKLRCFRRRPETSVGSGREILTSDYYSIPRAKLKRREVDETAPAEVTSRQLQRYLDDGGSISGESSGSSVQFERRVITDITTHEIKKTIYHDPETGQAVYEVTATASSSAANGGHSQFLRSPIEIESEQHAGEPERFVRSSESVAGQQYPRSESTSRIGGSGRGTIRESGSREYTATRTTRQVADDYDEKEAYSQEDEIDDAVFDRTTKLSTRRDFEPTGYGHGGMERRRNELSTTTRSHETSYY
uniref:Transmembrane matrix receptor MUP-4 n=1 Tax=Loa loa TaxID=7209 RepID=A0A1I7VU29_LOALO